MTGKCAAFALLALHVQPPAMALQRVLDDGQTESGAALSPRSSGIDAVEALGQPGNVLRGYADAAVDDRKVGALFIGPPAHAHRSFLGRVFHRIDQDVGKGGFDLMARTIQPVARVELQKPLSWAIRDDQGVAV